MVIILISSLPDEYNYLITALETIAEEKLSWDYVRDRLTHEYEKLHGKGGSESEMKTESVATCQDALLSRKSTENKKVENTAKKFTCHYCKKPGHFARDCYKKKADARSKQQKMSANIAEMKSNDVMNDVEKSEDMKEPEIALFSGNHNNNDWWIDSGASQHMSPNKKEMDDYTNFKKPLQIRIADNTILFAYGKGNLRVLVFDGKEKLNIMLKEVLYVPKLRNKLLSLPSMTEKAVEVQFKGQSCKLVIDDKVYSIGHKHGKLYKLNVEPEHSCCFGSADECNDLTLWHNRYGHLGYDNLKLLSDKSMVDGMDLKSKEKADQECKACAFGKQTRQSFPKKSSHQSTQLLELIQSDVCGPMNVASVGASRYFVTFIDDFSRYNAVYFMKNKSEVLDKFKEFVAVSENQTGKKVKRLRADNGGEYTSGEFKKYCKNHGILQEATIPYTPQQNGVSERMNRTIMDAVRSMLHHGGLPKRFWAEAVATVVYIRNRSPTSCLKEKTPYEIWHGEKPNVNNLKVFGCNALVHVPDEKRSKLDKKSVECVFVGYPSGTKGYKLYNLETKQMIRSRDVIFMENSFGNDLLHNEENRELYTTEKNSESAALKFENVVEENNVNADEDHAQAEPEPEIVQRRSQRNIVAPDRYGCITGDWWNYASLATTDSDEPKNITEAFNSKNGKQWRHATDDEYNSLIKNNTWELVDLPDQKNVVGCKWLFKLKRNADGSVSRYKSRLVAQGFTQQEGEDYDEIFAPVAKYNSIRSVLAIANQLDMDIHQMDVKTAFLYSNLEKGDIHATT